jgi:imidazolonepropionase-like amidohydrolase
MPLIIKRRVIPLAASDPNRTFPGRVFLNDAGTTEAVTNGHGAAPTGFAKAPVVDLGNALVVPGLIDLPNHLGYNSLPLWAEPAQKKESSTTTTGLMRAATAGASGSPRGCWRKQSRRRCTPTFRRGRLSGRQRRRRVAGV